MEEVVDDCLRYDRNSILAVGDEKSFRVSYKGTLRGNPVVVNKTLLREIETLTTDESLSRIRHANVAPIQHIAKDEDFRYDVVEEYAASLDCFFLQNDDPKKYNKSMLPSNDQVLLQLAKGLDYLHSLNILHGDIKPENILISATTPVQMKWTGFGFRRSRVNYSVTTNVTTRMAPRKWWPPEMYQDNNKQSKEGEIFSAGCVFLYFISGGLHPFASANLADLESNVMEGRPINLIGPNREALSTTQFAFVKKMIQKIPSKRIPLRKVILRLENQRHHQINTRLNFSSLDYEGMGYVKNGRYFYGEFCLRKPDELNPDGLAVKRIPKNSIASVAMLNSLKNLRHSNVVHFFECHKDFSYKYFSMEYCSASLDHVFLPKGDPKKYCGPIPSHEQFFLQILHGLQYIHETSNLVHGSIKPPNILINGTEDPQIKLGDFGLMIPQWEINSGSPVSFPGFQSEQYWLAPELLTILTNPKLNGKAITLLKSTKESDIFATGKVFFYYYYQLYAELLMPNGNDTNTPDGQYVFKKFPVNNKDKNNNGILIQLIDDMTKEENHERWKLPAVIESVKSFNLTSKGELEKPKESQSGNIKFSREFILGVGSYGKVHLGLWGGSMIAAVKRILLSPNHAIVIERENELQQLNHRNVVKFYDSEEDSDFKYIVMEKCLTSVDSYCRLSKLYRGAIPMPSDINVLLEMATGLQYIHSKNLIHRDVKPGNILISYGNPAIIKWTDFGLSKETRKKHAGEDVVTWTARQGTKGWKAPEVEKNEVVKAGEKSDIFSLGCVFFFFLTPAIHPFGKDSNERRKNIMSYSSENEPININELPKQHFAFIVIKEMLQLEELARPNISKVIEDLEACRAHPACDCK